MCRARTSARTLPDDGLEGLVSPPCKKPLHKMLFRKHRLLTPPAYIHVTLQYYEQINAHTGGGGTIDVGLDSTQMARIMRWHRIQCGGNKGKGSERDSASKTVEAIYGARKGGAFSTHIQKDFRPDSEMHLAALQRMAYEGKVIDGLRLGAATFGR